MRDERPFGGEAPPAVIYYASSDRRGEHRERHLTALGGILLADAHSGFNGLFDPKRRSDPITPAFCWVHSRRLLFELADLARNTWRTRTAAAISPIAPDAARSAPWAPVTAGSKKAPT